MNQMESMKIDLKECKNSVTPLRVWELITHLVDLLIPQFLAGRKVHVLKRLCIITVYFIIVAIGILNLEWAIGLGSLALIVVLLDVIDKRRKYY